MRLRRLANELDGFKRRILRLIGASSSSSDSSLYLRATFFEVFVMSCARVHRIYSDCIRVVRLIVQRREAIQREQNRSNLLLVAGSLLARCLLVAQLRERERFLSSLSSQVEVRDRICCSSLARIGSDRIRLVALITYISCAFRGFSRRSLCICEASACHSNANLQTDTCEFDTKELHNEEKEKATLVLVCINQQV